MNENWWIILGEGLAISLIGSLLHFTYGWSKQNKLVGVFSAVNESTWEHIKLALSGIFCCTLVDVWFLGGNPNYWYAKVVSFLVPIFVIPVLFYGYRAILKVKSCLPIDIALFFVASFASSAVFVWFLSAPPMKIGGEIFSMAVATMVFAAYLLLTRFPMHNFLFRDPITGRYGYDGFRRLRLKKKSKK